ncbi:hypothetical protein GGI07_005566 [Coemansia sp. Benny D115]|nr:hypothetical protein GGI07_005566 [Coemansia sp. Benny D115]
MDMPMVMIISMATSIHSACNNGGHGDMDFVQAAGPNDEEESGALVDVLAAFMYYKTYTLNNGIYRRLHHIDSLSEQHRSIVAALGTIDKIKCAEKLVRVNNQFLQRLVYASAMSSVPDPMNESSAFKEWSRAFFKQRETSGKKPVIEGHMEKVYSTLKQFVRDWSEEGAVERTETYSPLLRALESEYAHVEPSQRGKIHVLVPGAGLGRLMFEICSRGFSCQGNEFSYFMLLASNFILNRSTKVNEHTIHPFVHQFSNVVCASDQMRSVRVPDVLPTDLPYSDTAEFSMTAGDFIEVYGTEDERGKWDAIVTCFFMDTAKNALDYLDTIWHAMKPGAVWINLGPLLWHFDNVDGEMSIEFTREEFVELVTKVGFELDDAQFKERVAVSYTANSKSMLQYTYQAFMCIARKPMHNIKES